MALVLTILAIGMLALVSLFTGITDISPFALLSWDETSRASQVLLISRIPRTIALILAGSAMAICGMIMQMLARNRFVEPTTAGTAESAVLGLLIVTIFAPGWPVFGKMMVAAVFALIGTALFLTILRRIPLRSTLLVPLIGLMLGGVINAIATFIAYRYDLLQSIIAWTVGDFSAVMRGRYELLWLSAALTFAAFLAADRFTLAGMGEAFTTNLGLSYRKILVLGLSIVGLATAMVVVTVGVIPFLGLIIPNVVSLMMGDNLRRTTVWVALLGAGFVLACDIAGRLVRFPYEIPIATIAGVIGSAVFLGLILRQRQRHG